MYLVTPPEAMKFQLHRPLSPSGWVHACGFFSWLVNFRLMGLKMTNKRNDLCEAPCGDTNIAVFRISPRKPMRKYRSTHSFKVDPGLPASSIWCFVSGVYCRLERKPWKTSKLWRNSSVEHKGETIISRWFKVTFLSPYSWRSPTTFEFGSRELTIPKKVTIAELPTICLLSMQERFFRRDPQGHHFGMFPCPFMANQPTLQGSLTIGFP